MKFVRLFCFFIFVFLRPNSADASIKLDFVANVVYNKLSMRTLNLPEARFIGVEPKEKVWFHTSNRTIYALPLFGDYPGPFHLHFRHSEPIEVKLQFELSPSTSLFSPSDHLLLARLNLSSRDYRNSSTNRFLIVQTLSLALNISTDLLTIHRINGSMIHVYFSCDFFHSTNLSEDIQSLLKFSQTTRRRTPIELLELVVVRLSKSPRAKTAFVSARPRLRNVTLTNPLLFFEQVSQPLVLVPLLIIVVGLLICSSIGLCLCCHRRSSSSSTLLLPSGRAGSPNNKHLYENYAYRKYRQQQEMFKRKKFHRDQRQFISKGIPVVFAEELDEKLEQTHTPLVMRIEREPIF